MTCKHWGGQPGDECGCQDAKHVQCQQCKKVDATWTIAGHGPILAFCAKCYGEFNDRVMRERDEAVKLIRKCCHERVFGTKLPVHKRMIALIARIDARTKQLVRNFVDDVDAHKEGK